MRFNAVFRPSKGGCLASGDWTNIGLDGLDQIRATNPDAKLSAVQPFITDHRWTSITIELSEEIARDCGSLFLNSREIEILVTQNSPDDEPLQRFAHTKVGGTSQTRLVWALNPDDVKFSWLLAGAPLLWDAGFNDVPKPDGPDDDHEYLGEATLSKLREGADNLQFDDPGPDQSIGDLRSAVVAAHDALLKWLTANPLNWAGTVKPISVLNDIDRCLYDDNKVGAIRALRKAFPVASSPLAGVKHAVEARMKKMRKERIAPWKDALLNELTKEDACIMGSIEKALDAVPNDVDFDEVAPNSEVRDLIQYNEGWLTDRPIVVELLPTLWRKFYYSCRRP